ncbi:MAG TPA: hypothetical protein VF175_10665 [Lacipirellula sp.]
MNARVPLWAATVVAAFACNSSDAETFEALASRILPEANALVLIDVEQILQAPLAQRQGWAARLQAAYVNRPVFLPPEAKKLALGAALQPANDFLPSWEVAVMELAGPVGIASIARAESGYLDELHGLQVAVTPNDAAFAGLGTNVLAAVRPAERQFLSRSIAYAKRAPELQLSDYLQGALPLINERVQVLLAVDLSDVVSPHDIQNKLAEAPFLASNQADLGAMAQTLTKLRGAALRLAIGNDCKARLQIDFDADVASLKQGAKPLLLHVLGGLGFQTQSLDDWKVSFAPQSIRMEGVLSEDAQRRVFSVIELPAADLSASADAHVSAAKADDSEMRESSLAYFKATEVLLKDLRKGLKDTKATSAWMERYARRIDELPSLNVDELLLNYGDKLAETLRAMSLAKRQAGIQYGVRATEGGGYGFYDGYYYGENAYDQAAQRSQVRKEEMAVASNARVEGWQLIDNATADLRRTLTKKYSVQF